MSNLMPQMFGPVGGPEAQMPIDDEERAETMVWEKTTVSPMIGIGPAGPVPVTATEREPTLIAGDPHHISLTDAAKVLIRFGKDHRCKLMWEERDARGNVVLELRAVTEETQVGQAFWFSLGAALLVGGIIVATQGWNLGAALLGAMGGMLIQQALARR